MGATCSCTTRRSRATATAPSRRPSAPSLEGLERELASLEGRDRLDRGRSLEPRVRCRDGTALRELDRPGRALDGDAQDPARADRLETLQHLAEREDRRVPR